MIGAMKKPPKTTAIARRLRQDGTDAEKTLWKALRSKQSKGVKFRRQQPIGLFIVDFVSLNRKLVIEVDGGQHNDPETVERDQRRTAWLQGKGYRVLRFWDNDVFFNIEGVLEQIGEELKR